MTFVIIWPPYQWVRNLFFFVDDGTIHAPHHVMLRIIQYLQIHGPRYGYNIKADKGERYLLGSYGGDFELVHQRLLALRNFGLAEDILRVHPGDGHVHL